MKDNDTLLKSNEYSKAKEFISLCASIKNMTSRIRESQVSIEILANILNGLHSLLKGIALLGVNTPYAFT
jgi:hypothetical protein